MKIRFFGWRGMVILVALLSALSSARGADESVELLARGDNDLWAAQLIGETDSAQLSRATVNHANFPTAWQLQTVRKPSQPQGVGLESRNALPVQRGDVLLADFWTRAVPAANQTSAAAAWVSWQQAQTPWADSLSLLISSDGQWKHWQLPFVAKRDYAVGEARWVFFAGYQTQILQIGAVSVRDFGPNAKIETLPHTRDIYDGQDLNADWRTAANARIAKIRQGALQVLVSDAKGAVVPDARVQVKMLKHAWNFGASVSETRILNDGGAASAQDDETYRQNASELFNQFVLEGGATRWYAWEASGGQFKKAHLERGHQSLSWLRSHSRFGPRVSLRAVPVVWPSWAFSGASAQTTYENTLAQKGASAARQALRERVRAHVRETLSEYASQIDEWDVINEPIAEHQISDLLGRGAMAEWLQIARETDPDAQLFLNDFNVLSGGGYDREHQDALFELTRDLLGRGAPLDGLGFQAHMGASPTPPAKLLAILDRFATLNRALQITEFDTTFVDEQLQADYLRDFLTVMFSHPAVRGVCLWGFWDGQHWNHNGALFDQNWQLKAAGKVWKQLVFGAWWTNADGTTDAKGQFSTRAFYGDYQITVEHNGQTIEKTFALRPANLTLKVVLGDP